VLVQPCAVQLRATSAPQYISKCILTLYACTPFPQVTFEFVIDLSRLSRPGVIEAFPSSGKVAAGEKCRVKLKVSVGVDTMVAAQTSPASLRAHLLLPGWCTCVLLPCCCQLSNSLPLLSLRAACRSRQACLTDSWS
jgi:hypothetical protein